MTWLSSGLCAHSSFQKIAVACVLVEVTAKLQGIHRDHDQCKVARSGATNSSHCIGFLKEYIATDYPLSLSLFYLKHSCIFSSQEESAACKHQRTSSPLYHFIAGNKQLFKTPAAFVRSDFEHSVVICDRCILLAFSQCVHAYNSFAPLSLSL